MLYLLNDVFGVSESSTFSFSLKHFSLSMADILFCMENMTFNVKRLENVFFFHSFWGEHLTLVVGEKIFAHEHGETGHVVIRSVGTSSVYFLVFNLSNFRIIFFSIGLIYLRNVSLPYNFNISGFGTFFSFMVRFLIC